MHQGSGLEPVAGRLGSEPATGHATQLIVEPIEEILSRLPVTLRPGAEESSGVETRFHKSFCLSSSHRGQESTPRLATGTGAAGEKSSDRLQSIAGSGHLVGRDPESRGMTPERWQEIETLVGRALAAPGPRRARLLIEACGSDRQKLEESLDLLLATAEADALRTHVSGPEVAAIEAEESALALAPTLVEPRPSRLEEVSPRYIGPFRILEELGRGGMGTVYLAEPPHPASGRVAVKVAHPRRTAHPWWRPGAECDFLARLSHPGIAELFETGATGDGRTFFAMELVEGLPISEYCDCAVLCLEERLRLFQRLCDAVQHCHQRGVLHRDLKPANILVTEIGGHPVPKIIDFGIAERLAERLGPAALADPAVRPDLLGTPVYMAPERLVSPLSPPDPRQDVYSLGALLYELVTGLLPFPVQPGEPVESLVRRLAREEPLAPAFRWRELEPREQQRLARLRRVEPDLLEHQLAHGLGHIVARALARVRLDRYPSAEELAEDLSRYLARRVFGA